MALADPPERSARLDLLGDAPEDDLKTLFLSFHGRLPRKSFWLYGVLGLTLAQIFIGLLLGIAGVSEALAGGIAALAVAWPGLAIGVKRWHDRDKSGWWVLIAFVPIIGALWTLIECGFLRGTPGPNRFGSEPPRAGLPRLPGRA